jgi:hypothetical protein
MSGLTPEGFVIETLEDIKAGIENDLRAAFGQSIDLTDASNFGKIVGIVSERFAVLWELAEAINSSQDPDSAMDAALEAIAAITGTLKESPRPSTVTLTLTGTPATDILTGSRSVVPDTGSAFITTADATITLLESWQSTVAYALDERVTNNSRVYQCIGAGTSAGSGGPTTTAASIVDGTVTWKYLGEGTGAIDVASESVENGAIIAVAGDISEIDTPVAGWSNVTNLLDADLGVAQETNEDLRVRREEELADVGSSPLDAIRAKLLKVTGVTAVTMFQNVSDITDSDGLPPHSVEALVTGGEDQAIRDALLAAVAGGIQTHGTVTGTATDSEGTSHTIKFSRPNEIEIYVDVELTKDADEYPLDGDDQIKAKIVAYGDAQRTGKNAVATALIAQCFKVSGVLDVTVMHIGLASNPSASTTIAIDSRELAKYDTSRITVLSSDGTP